MKQTPKSVALMLGLLLCGCGGADSGSSNGAGTDLSQLPSDPGAEGKRTLAGIDSDQDGVRDDVQIAIFNRYPNDATKRKALEQDAKALQAAIIAGDSGNRSEIEKARKIVSEAGGCLFEKFDDSWSEIGFMELKMINTSDRGEAYMKFNAALDGGFYSGRDDNPCQ